MSNRPTEGETDRLRAAAGLLQQGRPVEAISSLRSLVADSPNLAEAYRLLGVALTESGALVEAEAAFRHGLAIQPNLVPAAVGLAEVLNLTQRVAEAVDLLQTFAAADAPDINLLTALGVTLQSLGRLDEAIAVFERGVAAAPQSGVAEHNLASAQGDAQAFAESEASTRRAFAKGLGAPETWLVHARALQGQDRMVDAETAYREALKRRPNDADVLGEFSQMVWMQTGDRNRALSVLDEAIERYPNDAVLYLKRAKILEYLGDFSGAYEAVARTIQRGGEGNTNLHALAARIAINTNPLQALKHAERATALSPNSFDALSALCQACLAVGQFDLAVRIAEDLHHREPSNQFALALTATAWRLLGDPRYAALYDYENLIGSSRLETPRGWPSLEAYLADLKPALDRLHTAIAHPIGQSLRHGSQTQQDLSRSTDPVVRAFFEAIDGPIRRHIESLGRGEDVDRGRSTGNYKFSGIWSVKLRPDGYHVDHVHPKGWISSACYIDLPSAVETGREGWIKFGEPGVPTEPKLAAEHFLKPVVGQLVLFPSYMWHGTLPFTGSESRLTIAFDLVPA